MGHVKWIDAAKGIAICLVVLLHSCEWLIDAGLGVPQWDAINEMFITLRMPLFFLVSGLLASKWIQRSWRSLVTNKLLFLYWTFLLWSIIGSAFYLAGLSIQRHETTLTRFLGGLALSLVRPRFELWFLWALALFFIVAKLTRRWPIVLQLALASALALVWQSKLLEVNIGWDGAAKNYLFFLAGLSYRPEIFEALVRVPRWTKIAVVVIWSSGAAWMVMTGAEDIPGVRFAGTLLGVAAGVFVSSMLKDVRILGYLGARTLPIYLAHTPILILADYPMSFGLLGSLPVGVRSMLPLIVAPCAIAVALGIYRLAMAANAGFLYTVPPGISARMSRRFRVDISTRRRFP